MSSHRHQTYKPGCFRCDLGLDEEGGHVVAIHRDDLRALLAPAIDPDDEALVEKVARLIAHSALDWTDYATGEHDHSPACSNWEAYTDDARAVLAEATS